MDDYNHQWKILRKLSTSSLLLYGIFLLLLLSSSRLLRSFQSSIFFAVLALCFALLVVVKVRLHQFLCPRCGQRFFMSIWLVVGGFNDHCAYCGLKKFGSGGSHEDL